MSVLSRFWKFKTWKNRIYFLGRGQRYGRKKKDKPIDLHNLTPEEQLKLEIAQEIGVFDKVLACGWRSLSAKESGKIGGLMTKRRKELDKEARKGTEEI